MVAVMAAQALAFARSDKGMVGFPLPAARQLAIRILEMTGCASAAVSNIGVIIPLAVHMATQALAAEQIVHQLLFGLRAPHPLESLSGYSAEKDQNVPEPG